MSGPVLALSLLFLSSAPADKPVDPLDGVRTAILDGDYHAAIAGLETLVSEGGKDTDLYRYLIAGAHSLAGEHEKAIAAFDALIKASPPSRLKHKATFRKADVLARGKRYKEAVEIYEQEILRITSRERKQKLAGIYIKFADGYFSPGEGKKPEYAKARELYQKSLEVGPAPEEADRIRFLIGRCFYEEGNHNAAAEHLERERRENPGSPHLSEVTYYLGLALFHKNDRPQARRVLLDFLKEFPESNLGPDVTLWIARTYGIPKPADGKDLDMGVKYLRSIVDAGKGERKLLAKAHHEIGMSYFHLGRDEDAIRNLSEFTARYRGDASIEELPLAMVAIGDAQFRQKRYGEAAKTWRQYLVDFPSHRDWSATQRKIIDLEYSVGQNAFQEKKYPEAIQAWEEFLNRYPLDERSPKIHLLIGKIHYEEKRYEKAIEQWSRLVSKYPNTEPSSEAQYWIGYTWELRLHDFKKAREAYGALTWGGHQPKAKARLEALDKKYLAVRTERAFRSDEKPLVKVTTRNLPKLELRAYRVDMETYFRKVQSFAGMETLDVALIEPDRTWSFEIPDYEKCREIETEVPMPFTEPGLYVVKCGDEDLEATTVLLRSDIALATRSSRRDILVFAQGTRTGAPSAGCRVLVSDGNKVFLEGETDERGFFYRESEDLRKAPEVRVFGITGGSAAGTGIGLGNVAYMEGIQPRGFIYTDRPAYRPGETVHVRGIIRRAERGSYVFTPGAAYDVDILASTGDPLDHRKVELSRAGTFSGDFTLSPASPLGTYRIVARQSNVKEGPTFSGSFEVKEYKLEKIRLAIDTDTDRGVYLRGEKVTGKIKAEYYYGEPVANRPVTYRMNGIPGDLHGTTDRAGEIPFEFDTKELSESQITTIWAKIDDESVQAQRIVWISTTGYTLSIETLRDVYVAGEPFDVTVKAIGIDGKPKEAEVTVKALKIERAQGRRGEVEAAHRAVKTDPEKGAAKARLELAEGAEYILRAEGKDRFGNAITTDRRVFISGKDDEIKIRILADSETFRLGETPEVTVLCRTKAPLAVLTFEGEGIYHYETRRIEEGKNTIALDLKDAYAPNFRLGVMVMDGNTFHAARKEFIVEKGLNITIEPEKDEARPGEEIAIRIRTTDVLGRPVEAEASIALVDASLLAAAPGSLADIRDFFYQVRRGVSSAEGTTCTFSYQGKTAPVPGALVEEARRIQREELPKDEPLVAFDVQEEDAFADDALGIPVVNFANAAQYSDFALVPTEQFARGDANLNGWVILEAADPVVASGAASGRHHARRYLAPMELLRGRQLAAGQTVHVLNKMPVAGYGSIQNRLLLDAGQLGAFSSDGRVNPNAFNVRLMDVDSDGRLGDLPLFGAGFGRYGYAGQVHLRTEAVAEAIRRLLSATAYWNAAVRTGPDGRGEVKVRIPERQTRWTIVSYGVTPDTLVGHATADLASRKDFFIELKHPRTLTEGDKTTIEVGVHNLTGEGRRVSLSVSVTVGAETHTARKEVDVEPKSTSRAEFPFEVGKGESLVIQAEAKSGDLADTASGAIPVLAWATEIREGIGGTSSMDLTRWIEIPERRYEWKALDISVGPSLERSFLDLADEPTVSECLGPRSNVASRGLTLLEVMDYLQAIGGSGSGLRMRLERALIGILGQLYSSQNDDGGWGWSGRKDRSDPYVSAQSYMTLARAAAIGLDVPVKYTSKARDYLEKAFAGDDEETTKATVLHALSHGRMADFAHVNRLYRMRRDLGVYALARLAITLDRMERKDLAREVVEILVEKEIYRSDRIAYRQKIINWFEDDVEQAALAVLAIAKVDPRSPKVREGINWLQARRIGNRWPSAKGTAAAAAALGHYLSRARRTWESYELTIRVNDREVKKLRFDPESRTETFTVLEEHLKDGRNKIEFDLEGFGEVSYTASLKARVPGIDPAPQNRHVRVAHKFLPAPMVIDGKTIPQGFSVVEAPPERWENTFTQLHVGKLGTVEVTLWRSDVEGYFIHEEQIPAGCEVLPESIQGFFSYHEIGDGRIRFYLPQNHGTIRYEIHGALRGEYRILPSRTYPMYQPYRVTTGGAHTISVIPRDSKSTDPYRVTPDEHYHAGKLHFDRARYADARPHLTEIFENWQLKNDIYKDVTRMLLQIAIREKNPPEIVKYFEVLKERYPDLVLTFEDMITVGKAYTAIGEYERALQVYRGTAEASFIKEGNIAGTLKAQGQFLASVTFTDELGLDYPDLPGVQHSIYGLSQMLAREAENTEKIPELKQKNIGRREMLHMAAKRIERFLYLYPENPVADEAGFTLAMTYLELERNGDAVALAERLRKRFPTSRYLDSFFYIDGYSRFGMRDYARALELLRKVEEEEFPGPSGTKVPSEDRDLATYMAGQIYHSMGKPGDAIDRYTKVRTKFSDADEAIRHFEEKRLTLSEVTTVRVGEPATVEFRYRNIKGVRILTYRVDLMKLYLLRKNLSNITGIHLAGIHPIHEETIELGEGKDYRDIERTVSLPLKDEGAYLVVLKGGEIDASGMVLVTDLKTEVQEDPPSGRVRVNVWNAKDRTYLDKAHVKVIGQGNDKFTSGDTDLRGVFIADGILGRSTAIVKKGNQYAFHRGKVSLGGYVPPQPPATATPARAKGAKAKAGKDAAQWQWGDELFKANLIRRNFDVQGLNSSTLQQLYNNTQEGVEVDRAK